MGYPVSYRSSGPQGRSVTLAKPPVPRSGNLLRFPGAQPAELNFGPATRMPGRANFGIRQPELPGVELPRVGPGFPRFRLPSAGFLFAALFVADQLWTAWDNYQAYGAAGNAVRPVGGSGDFHCGPFFNTAGYYPQVSYWSLAGANHTCFADTGLQADSPSYYTQVPPPLTVYQVVGPHIAFAQAGVNRYYIQEQWAYDTTYNGTYAYAIPQWSPYVYVPGLFPPNGPPLAPVVVVPAPLYVSPLLPKQPAFPYGPSRGNDLDAMFGYNFDSPDRRASTRNTLNVDAVSPPQQRPPKDDPEIKLSGTSKVGRALVGGLKLASTYGATRGAVSAFWRALPSSYRTAGKFVSLPHMLADLARYARFIDLKQAAINTAKYWLMYKAAGAAYGAYLHALQDTYGGNTGAVYYRALATAIDQAEHKRIVATRDQLRADRKRHARYWRYIHWRNAHPPKGLIG